MKKQCLLLLLLLLPGILVCQEAVLISKDANFYKVDENLYRSEQIVGEDKSFVEAEKIKAIVNLRFFTRSGDRKVFGEDEMKLINYPIITWMVGAKEVADVLKIVREEQKKGGVLVHCYRGADRTGLVMGMYRVIFMGWSLEEAKKEMKEGPFGFHSLWKNIENKYNEEFVEEVKRELGEVSEKR